MGSLQLASQSSNLLFSLLRLLLVKLGGHHAHVLCLPVVADVAELSSSTVIDKVPFRRPQSAVSTLAKLRFDGLEVPFRRPRKYGSFDARAILAQSP